MQTSLSNVAKYISQLPVNEERDDHIVKIANARELIEQLPSPQNVRRKLDLVPDIDIAFALSTSPELPQYVAEQIEQSVHRNEFTKTSLLGLCTSGRGMPPEIFLHDHFMTASDPSGELLEEVTWHETVHGIEGIKKNAKGKLKRKEPWSYWLQQSMLAIDEENKHTPKMSEDAGLRAYTQYLRSGTVLQQNVSELFARVAVTYMYEIKETGQAIESFSEFFKLAVTAIRDENLNSLSRKEHNLIDFIGAWGTFSFEARAHLSNHGDNLIKRVAELYGCEMT